LKAVNRFRIPAMPYQIEIPEGALKIPNGDLTVAGAAVHDPGRGSSEMTTWKYVLILGAGAAPKVKVRRGDRGMYNLGFGRKADSLGMLSIQLGIGRREGEIRVGEILDPLLLSNQSSTDVTIRIAGQCTTVP
jgi:hypothetical protein